MAKALWIRRITRTRISVVRQHIVQRKFVVKNKEFRRNDRILESSEVLSSENSESVKIERRTSVGHTLPVLSPRSKQSIRG